MCSRLLLLPPNRDCLSLQLIPHCYRGSAVVSEATESQGTGLVDAAVTIATRAALRSAHTQNLSRKLLHSLTAERSPLKPKTAELFPTTEWSEGVASCLGVPCRSGQMGWQ